VARLALNKSSLSRQSRQLKTFQQFLPALDLKRRQLMAERSKARHVLARTREELAEFTDHTVGRTLPMLANQQVDLAGLVRVTQVDIGDENVVGTHLPILQAVHVEVHDYALLGKPHWVDPLVMRLKTALELRIRINVEERRLALLEQAVRIITQRVNLFDKVLIPRTQRNIKKVKLYLADQERSAVVNAKLAKAKLGGPAG